MLSRLISTAKSNLSEITHYADPRPLLPLQEKLAVSAEVALGEQLESFLLFQMREIQCVVRSFSFGQVAVAGKKCVWISSQSSPGDFVFHMLLFRIMPVIVIFQSKFHQISQHYMNKA